ncbi:MAG: HAD family phosphatase [Verrucomicrobiales bacterium]|jgi:HAD superfamily hydrolase (TIGR01509 family)|nr:HAD family phosphatase [Verrucomicrobiales bacterium]
MSQPSIKSPQVVVFDLGKVLLEFDYSIASRRLAESGVRNVEQIRELILQPQLLYRFETGLMTEQEFYQAVSQATGFRGSFDEFVDIFSNIFEPMHEMIELHAAIRGLGIPTFIFSNTNNIAIPHIRKAYPFFSNFNGYILSYEHGSMKPDAKLYEVVEQMTGCRGSNILYIDDRPENIETGVRRGWQVILQEDHQRTRAQVQARGLKV